MPEKLLRTVGVALLSIFLVVGSLRPALAADAATWDEALAQAADANGAAEISFTSDIALTDQSQKLVVKAGNTITLSGQGTITGAGLPAIEVEPGGRLVLAGPTFTEAQFVVEGAMDFNSGTIRDTEVFGPVIFVKGGELNITGEAAFTGNNVSQQTGGPALNGVQGVRFSPITVYNGTLNISGGTISKNVGFLRGGAIGLWNVDGASTLNLSGGEVVGNLISHPRSNGGGGGVYAEESTVNMTGGKIAGNSTEMGGGLNVSGGTLVMSAGEITENNNGEYKGYGGGVLLLDANSTISGGKISNNLGTGVGAGVDAERGTLKISGGEFTGNNFGKAEGDGGGLRILKAETHITGGTFSKNISTNWGGGINFTGGTATIDGGVFTENIAEDSGGAISFSSKGKYVINAAIIRGNTAKGFYGGGGIFNDNQTELHINNALIRGNVIKNPRLVQAGNHPVSAQGGGLWNCPYGQTVMHITNGVAIFDNAAPDFGPQKEYKGAGDDFASIAKHEFSNKVPTSSEPVSLTERMLGGGERVWYQDGSVYGIHSNWSAADQLPRYVEGGDNQRIPYNEQMTVNKVFKSTPTDEAKQIAEKLATVRIEDNVATNVGISGGGLGNNGQLTFGTEDVWTLKIKKSWDSDDPQTRPDQVTVDVLVGGLKVDQVKLNEANNWQSEVLNFPNPATLIDASTGEKLPITFRESGADGYTLTFTESVDNDTKVYTYSLVNKKQTEVSVKKVWDDSDDAHKLRPTSITVELLNHGEPAGKQLELSAENGWQGSFEKLPAYLEGKPAEYSVREVAVKNYQAEVTGDVKSGYVITNKVEPPPSTPPKPGVPKTGDFGWQFAALAGLIVAGGAAIALRRRRK